MPGLTMYVRDVNLTDEIAEISAWYDHLEKVLQMQQSCYGNGNKSPICNIIKSYGRF